MMTAFRPSRKILAQPKQNGVIDTIDEDDVKDSEKAVAMIKSLLEAGEKK